MHTAHLQCEKKKKKNKCCAASRWVLLRTKLFVDYTLGRWRVARSVFFKVWDKNVMLHAGEWMYNSNADYSICFSCSSQSFFTLKRVCECCTMIASVWSSKAATNIRCENVIVRTSEYCDKINFKHIFNINHRMKTSSHITWNGWAPKTFSTLAISPARYRSCFGMSMIFCFRWVKIFAVVANKANCAQFGLCCFFFVCAKKYEKYIKYKFQRWFLWLYDEVLLNGSLKDWRRRS